MVPGKGAISPNRSIARAMPMAWTAASASAKARAARHKSSEWSRLAAAQRASGGMETRAISASASPNRIGRTPTLKSEKFAG